MLRLTTFNRHVVLVTPLQAGCVPAAADRITAGAARAAGATQVKRITGHAARPTMTEVGILAHRAAVATAMTRAVREVGSLLIALAQSSTTQIHPNSTTAAGTATWRAAAHRSPLCVLAPDCASNTPERV
jgi:hypothetical protein